MPIKAHLDATGKASFICPACRTVFRKDLSAARGIGTGSRVRCSCPCGKRFTAVLERRRHTREATDLTGAYHHERHQFRGLIKVKNVSRSGAGIEMNAQREVALGDNLTLKFNLDDMSREAVIRKRDGKYLGVEFLNRTWDDDPLAAYLKKKLR